MKACILSVAIIIQSALLASTDGWKDVFGNVRIRHLPDDAAVFHLKPGAENGDGTEKSPFGTFAEAQAAVRQAVADTSLPSGKVTVVVHDGTYRVNEAVAFGKADSGTTEHPVVWQAENKVGVRITGGIPVPKLSPLADGDPNWKRIQKEVRKNILVADLKAAGILDYGEVKTQGLGGPYMELVYGDEPQTLARWPNEGYAEIADAESSTEQNPEKRKFYPRGFKYSGDRPSYWADETEACMNGFFFYWWAAHRVAVGSIDPDTKTILQKGGGDDMSKRPNVGSIWGYRKGRPWYGYNILRELDAPGEYYIDRRIGRLYFWPPKGNSAAEAELTMSEGVFAFDGVENVSLSGFVLENCRGVAFAARDCKNVEMTACVLRNVGGWAAEMKGCQDCRMAGCDIAWCNEGGVAMTGGDPKTLAHGNVVVENCHIHHFGRMQLTYCGGVDATGCGLAVRHNTIHDGPHLGIILRNISRECEVSWNELHSLCLESGEMGAFYAGRDWTLCGIRVEANWFHDIYNLRPQPNRAVMIDDGAAGLTVVSNWFTRVSEGVSLSGIGNVVENNVFMDCGVAISGWGCWKKPGDLTDPRMVYQDVLDRFAAISVHDEPWKSRYPYLGLIDDAIKNNTVRDPATRTAIRKNIWLNVVYAPILHFSGKIWDGLYSPVAWLEENNSEAGQPEPEGFAQMPPLYKIGVQNTPDRATWPVLHSVTVKGNSLKPDYWWLK